MTTLSVLPGEQYNIHITILTSGGAIENLQNSSESAVITWTVAGTSISKTTADWSIYPAYPLYEDVVGSGYISENSSMYGYTIRLFPADTIGLSGSYNWTLSITSGTTKTYTGTMVVGSASGWTQTIVPYCFTASNVPTIIKISNPSITQTVVPTCVTASSRPGVQITEPLPPGQTAIRIFRSGTD